ncbi:hypothetical protein ACQP2K_17310 [Microbispora siamensis]
MPQTTNGTANTTITPRDVAPSEGRRRRVLATTPLAALAFAGSLVIGPALLPNHDGRGPIGLTTAAASTADDAAKIARALQSAKEAAGGALGGQVVETILKAYGYKCSDAAIWKILSVVPVPAVISGVITSVQCYRTTSPDPSIAERRVQTIDWNRTARGTAVTGGASIPLNVRPVPNRSRPPLRTFPNGWKLVILCQTYGERAYGPYGWSNIWDYVGDDPSGMTRFVHDASVNTGSNSMVAGLCPPSVAGYGAGVASK